MKKHLANFSPLVFVAACALLAAIIGIFAVSNYQREKNLMQTVLLQKADTVKRIVYTSFRKSLRETIAYKNSNEINALDDLQRATEQAKEQQGVISVLVVRQDGEIIAGALNREIGSKVSKSDLDFIDNVFQPNATGEFFRYKKDLQNIEDSFQTVMVFNPIRVQASSMMRPRHIMPQYHQEIDNDRPDKYLSLLKNSFDRVPTVLIVELGLDSFNLSLKQQRGQIVVLSFVLLLVGIGGWLSLLTLQGFKGSQLKLSQLKNLTDHLVSSLPIGLICVDSNGQVQLANQAAIAYLPISQALVGSPLKNLLDKSWWLVISRSQASGFPVEISSLSKDGVSRIFLVTVVDARNADGKVDGYVVLIQDLTVQKNMEEELQRNVRLASLGKMAAGVAHELRNPLSSIKGLGTLLRSKFEKNSDEWQTAQVLVDEVERLNRSISELLNYAKPKEENHDTVNLKESIEKAASLINLDLKEIVADIYIVFPKEDVFVQGNLDRLNQVFLNLLLNSLQAISQNGVIEVECRIDGKTAIITIADDGCGVAPDILPHIFDPYFTTKNNGTGLGLAISSKIIEEHGGDLFFESTVAKGSVVTVRIPVSAKM